MNEPDEILHIALPDDWSVARADGEYRVSTRNRSLDEVGYIHCSYPRQLESVANRLYSDVAELVILHVEPEFLDSPIKVEAAIDDGKHDDFPHLYGPIPTSAVVATTWWDRGDDGVWHRPHTM